MIMAKKIRFLVPTALDLPQENLGAPCFGGRQIFEKVLQ